VSPVYYNWGGLYFGFNLGYGFGTNLLVAGGATAVTQVLTDTRTGASCDPSDTQPQTDFPRIAHRHLINKQNDVTVKATANGFSTRYG
jgi:hypothetical protein